MIHMAQSKLIPLASTLRSLIAFNYKIGSEILSQPVIRRGTIAKYDYDSYEENMKHYGQAHPPAYNMSNIPNNFPLFLSYGGRDALSDSNDVRHLLKMLKCHHKTKLKVRFLQNYAHGDFVMAVNAKQLVYDPLISFLNLF